MKKFKDVFIKIIMLIICLSLSMINVVYATDESGEEVFPINISDTVTQYKPWLKTYHITPSNNVDRGGEGCQVVESIAVSPVNSNFLMLGTDTSGVWRSEDAGENWYNVNEGINMWAGIDFEFHPQNQNVVFMIQGEPNTSSTMQNYMNNHELAGVYRSDDGGKTFSLVLNRVVLAPVEADKLIQFDSLGNVYVLTSTGIVKSTDNGNTWTELKNFDYNVVYDLAVSQNGMKMFYVDENSGLNSSFDGGSTWSNEFENAYSVEFSTLNENDIYTVIGGQNAGLYSSNNGAETWVKNSTVPESESGYLCNVKTVNRNGSLRIFVIFNNQGQNIRYSDNQSTWIKPNVSDQISVNPGISGRKCEGFVISKLEPDTIYCSYADCVYKSTDYGSNFSWCNSGFSASRVDEFKIDSHGKLWMGSMDYGLFRTTSSYANGSYPRVDSYLERTGKYGSARTIGAIDFDPHTENEMMISLGSQSEHILKRSIDGGNVWTDINVPATAYCGLIKYHNEDSNTIYTSYYTSRDGGITWVTNTYKIVSVNNADNDVIWGLDNKNLYVSKDSGITWKLLYTYDAAIYQVWADSKDSDSAWVSLNDGNFYHITYSNSNVAQKKISNIKNLIVQAVAQNPENEDHLIVGGKSTLHLKTDGLYETFDGGETWRNVNGLPSMGTVYEIAFSPISNEVFVSGYTGGILLYDYAAYTNWLEEQKTTIDIISSSFASFSQSVSTGELSAGTISLAKEMGDGSTLMDVFALTNNNYSSIEEYGKASVSFNVNSLRNRVVTDSLLKLNVKFQSSNTGTLFVYGIKNSNEYSNSQSFVDLYSSWSDLSPKVEEIATYTRAYGEAKTGTNIEIDITEFVAKAVERGWNSVDLIFEYKSSDASSNNRNAYIAVDSYEGFVPTISVESEKKLMPDEKIDMLSDIFVPFTQNTTTGELTSAAIGYAGNMGSGSTAMDVLVLTNNAYSLINNYDKGGVKFDVSSIFGRHIVNATLKLNVKFQSSSGGTLYVYGVNNAGTYVDSESFTNIYTNWSVLSPKVEEIATYTRAYGDAKTGTDIEIDITDFVMKVVESGWNSVDLMFEYRSSDTNSNSRSAYVAVDSGEGFVPEINVTLLGAISPSFISANGEIENLLDATEFLTVSYDTKRGVQVQTTAVPILAIYDADNRLLEMNFGESVVLDGKKKSLTVTTDITKTPIEQGCFAKFFVWKNLTDLIPIQNYTTLLATE